MRKDVFHSFLVENAEFDGKYELPEIRTSDKLPEKVVIFSKAMAKNFKDFNCWVIFYEDDWRFERLWHNPKAYLAKLKKFKGVISPDFSLYRDMPLCMQIWNTYRGRAIASWLQNNGVEIIPNIRYNDNRTYEFCFDGIEKNKTVAVGTHGCIKKKSDREIFAQGLAELVNRLKPQNIVVYGSVPDDIFGIYRKMGVNIIPFECELSKSRKRGNA